MFQNYVRVAVRNLIKHKLFSAINIIGLAVGLAACVLISLFVRDELTYDTQWHNADRIYRLTVTFDIPGRPPIVTAQAQGPARAALKSYFPEEIDKVTRFANLGTVLRYQNNVYSQRVMWTDPETADIFNFDVVAGDIHKALNDKASLAVSQSFARKYFGSEDPIGKVVTLSFFDVTRDYQVAAVFKDLPHNTVLKFGALAKIDEADFAKYSWMFSEWFSVNNYIYFTLKPGASIGRINSQLAEFSDKNIDIPPALTSGQKVPASKIIHFQTMSIRDIELHSPQVNSEMKVTGSITNVIVFSAIAVLILVIACINFMNLATAKSTQRAREVALRKVLGAKRRQLMVQFIGESVLIAVIGLVLGLVLIEAVLPSFGAFVHKPLTVNYGDPLLIGLLIGLAVVVGVVGGLYPALILSGFLPARVLKANKSAETSGSAALRSVLVVVQFAISIALIISAGVVYGQKLYATSMDPGFDKDNLLVVRNLGRSGAKDKQQAFKEAVLNLPGVQNATLSGTTPGPQQESNTSVTIPGDPSHRSIVIGVETMDYDFLDTYKIKLLAGRTYSRDHATDGLPDSSKAKPGEVLQGTVVINQGALKRLGFGTPEQAIGRTVKSIIGGSLQDPIYAVLTVIGVMQDIHSQSLKQLVRPEMYQFDRSSFGNLTIRFKGNPEQLVEQVQNLWKTMVPGVPFRYDYIDQVLAEEFTLESHISMLLGIFSALAVLIACLGLYGLASFTAERRTKEIGIRKVMGATVFDVVRLLIWQFSKPVLLANLIAWPVAAYALVTWLQGFPYRLNEWLLVPFCLVAGLIALVIAWVTVGGNAARVARANPIKALRYE